MGGKHGVSEPHITPRTRKLPTRLVEVWYLCDVAEVDDGVVLNLFGDRVQRLVHHHALRVPVVPETNDDDAILFGFDRLVDVPARGEVRQEIRHAGMPSLCCVCGKPTRSEASTHVTERQTNRNPDRGSPNRAHHRLDGPQFLSLTHNTKRTMASTQRPIVFMDVNIGETPAGRLKMELFSDVVPKYVASVPLSWISLHRSTHVLRTAENFRQLCTGEYRVNSRPQGYKGATFHR